MDLKLEKKLLKRFPVIYQQYYDDAQSTCLCWGMTHDNGWFKILWDLSLAIEKELNYSWFQKHKFLFKKRLSRQWNKWLDKLSPVYEDDFVVRFFKKCSPISFEGQEEIESLRLQMLLKDPMDISFQKKLRLLGLKMLYWYPYTGFAATQVKEKFGILRFYTTACTEPIYKLIQEAEHISSITCEVCGKPGTLRIDGWYKTRCDHCQEEYDYKNGTLNGIKRAKRAIKKQINTKKKTIQ